MLKAVGAQPTCASWRRIHTPPSLAHSAPRSLSLQVQCPQVEKAQIDFKGLAREDSFNRKAEILADPKRQLQAESEIAAFNVAYRRQLNLKSVCKRAAAETALGRQDCDSVE